MSAPLTEIIAAADDLLASARFEDYCLNGLQVPGAAQVESIATGVSANVQLFELAAEREVGLLLVHHGLFWGSGVRLVDPMLKRRLKLLFDYDISLAAYHLPLDAHPEIGNNALLARALGAEPNTPFASHRGLPFGFLADFPPGGVPVEELLARVTEVTEREPLLLGAGPARVERLAVVSGSGSDYVFEAAEAGAQALLTGEPAERATANAAELGVHVIAAGHHATERLGIQRLGEHLADRFGLEHVFLDVPNPV